MNKDKPSLKPNTEELPEEPKRDVNLAHRFNYVGGHYAFKNSSKKGQRLDPENLKPLVLMMKPGQAAKVNMSMPTQDPRAGIYPQHNSPEDFRDSLELISAKTLEPYAHLVDVASLVVAGFDERICSLTKQRLNKIRSQFCHLQDLAFNQMLDIPRPDKRDFPVWHKVIPKNKQVLIAFPAKKTKQVIFVQVIQYDDEGNIIGVKHCSFGAGEPFVINESLIDKYGNYRQIAHLGKKDNSDYANSVERFDDGTVAWIVTHGKDSGAAALRPNGEIIFVENQINDISKIAARNLGAEAIRDGNWSGEFSIEACQPDAHVMQVAFKDKVRKQISQIIDGAAIPGLDPVFWVEI